MMHQPRGVEGLRPALGRHFSDWSPRAIQAACRSCGLDMRLTVVVPKGHAMNHDQFVESIMRSAGLTKANVNRFYAGLVELARKELVRNRHFVLPGLGSLRVKVRKARTGRNPRTGELMQIAPRKVVRFHAFGNLRAMVNPSGEPLEAPESHDEEISA